MIGYKRNLCSQLLRNIEMRTQRIWLAAGLYFVAILFVTGTCGAGEASWQAVEQPELKVALDGAPTLKT